MASPDSRRKKRIFTDPPIPGENKKNEKYSFSMSWNQALPILAIMIVIYIIGRSYGVFC